MNSIPSALASRGDRISAGWPLIFTVPASREIAPPRIFISVDLPAPFSPINATISPAPTVIRTSSSATTPGNRLLIPSISRIGASAAIRLAAAESVYLFGKRVDIVFLHCLRRYKDLFACGNLRSIAIKNLRHQLHRLVTKLKGLLNDGRINRAIFDSSQRWIFFVESDDLHFI